MTSATCRLMLDREAADYPRFADRHGLTSDQVRELIRQHGNDRDDLERAAASLKKT